MIRKGAGKGHRGRLVLPYPYLTLAASSLMVLASPTLFLLLKFFLLFSPFEHLHFTWALCLLFSLYYEIADVRSIIFA